jgi:hypothetical protein
MARIPHSHCFFGLIALLMFSTHASAQWDEQVLYSFHGGSDGYYPAGGVIFDKSGSLYGANSWGGSGGCPSPGCGTVFRISRSPGGVWTDSTIYAFQGVLGDVKDGFTPVGGVIVDHQGNLYGTTSMGGSGPCIIFGSPAGCGTVYELSPPTQKGGQWSETIIYNFQGGNDGYFPEGNLAFDEHGNLYGATWFGGGHGTTCNLYYGGNCGSVFELIPPKKKSGSWTEKVLHGFAGGTDGANPNGGLTVGHNAVIYGLTYTGGNQDCNYGSGYVGCGTAFELKKKGDVWTERIIHRFDRTSSDGGNPMAGMVSDAKDALYGTTLNGGPGPGGIVFRLNPPSRESGRWKETVLHGFNGNYWNGNGYDPECSLVFDSKGRLYGTTSVTGAGFWVSGGVFRLTPQHGKWIFDQLYSFKGVPDGAQSTASVVLDNSGNVYGTTLYGGSGTGCGFGGCGTVFEVSLP